MELAEKIVKAWDLSAEGYSKRCVIEDFISPGKETWTNLLTSLLPKKGKLNILDVGTGPGVFATLLSLEGHNVVGIDISGEMLKEARENSMRMGTNPTLMIMDTQNPTFDDESFDMIVSRNVMWIMEEPEKTYANWLRMLRPGGRVVVFDGGHPARSKEEFKPDHGFEKEEEYQKRFGEPMPLSFEKSQWEIARGWKRELPLTYVARPEWDLEAMNKTGYTNVTWENVNDKVSYNEKLKFMNEGRVFMCIRGDKPID